MKLFDSIKSLFCGKKDDVKISPVVNTPMQSTDSLVKEFLKLKEEEKLREEIKVLKEVDLKLVAIKFKTEVRSRISPRYVPIDRAGHRGYPDSIDATYSPSLGKVAVRVYMEMKCSYCLPKDSAAKLFDCLMNDMFQNNFVHVDAHMFKSIVNDAVIQLISYDDWLNSRIECSVPENAAIEDIAEEFSQFIIKFAENISKLE